MPKEDSNKWLQCLLEYRTISCFCIFYCSLCFFCEHFLTPLIFVTLFFLAIFTSLLSHSFISSIGPNTQPISCLKLINSNYKNKNIMVFCNHTKQNLWWTMKNSTKDSWKRMMHYYAETSVDGCSVNSGWVGLWIKKWNLSYHWHCNNKFNNCLFHWVRIPICCEKWDFWSAEPILFSPFDSLHHTASIFHVSPIVLFMCISMHHFFFILLAKGDTREKHLSVLLPCKSCHFFFQF